MRETILHTIKECKWWKKPTLESKRGHKMHESAKEKSGGYRKTLPLHGQGHAGFYRHFRMGLESEAY